MHFHPLEAGGELFRDSSVSEKEWTAEGAQRTQTSGRQEPGEAAGRAPASGDAAGGGQGPTDSLLLPGRGRHGARSSACGCALGGAWRGVGTPLSPS